MGTLSQCVLDNSTLLRQKDSPSAVKITYWALCNTVGYYTSDVDFPLFIALQTHKEKGGGHGRTGCHSCFNITNIDRWRLRSLKTVIQGYFTGLNQDQSRNTKQCIFKQLINQSKQERHVFVLCEMVCSPLPYVTMGHKTSLKSLRYICSDSQKYTAWVKIIDFSFMPKIIGILNKDHVPWRYFVNFLL